MVTAIIRHTVDPHSMGDGWKNCRDAAEALAAKISEIWGQEMDRYFPETDYKIDVDADDSRASAGVSVDGRDAGQ